MKKTELAPHIYMLLVALLLMQCENIFAENRVVMNTHNAGPGSLRQALSDAEPGDRIVFNIPGDGPHVISASDDPLTVRADFIEIDGYTQSGAAEATGLVPANIPIVLDGTGANVDGLTITSHNARLRGLVVQNFQNHLTGKSGIKLLGNNNRVSGSYIGTDGAVAQPNNVGITIYGEHNLIGGSTVADTTVVSGNTGSGIIIESNNNRIENCYIGTDNTATTTIANELNGIEILDGNNNTIQNSVVSGSGANGIRIASVTTNANENKIINTLVGTDATGFLPLPNERNGIIFQIQMPHNTTTDNLIRSSVIAFNHVAGIVNHQGVPTGNSNHFETNAIHSNGRSSIQLLNNGNHSQTTPVITQAARYESEIKVSGILRGRRDTDYRIEFFANDRNRNPEGITEGKKFIASITARTDSKGNYNFTEALQIHPNSFRGQFICATAINAVTGDTSAYGLNKRLTQRRLIRPID